jgi:hypothetical protein
MEFSEYRMPRRGSESDGGKLFYVEHLWLNGTDQKLRRGYGLF